MNKNRVMICDDDPVIHSTIKAMLSEYDDVFEFVSVYDGESLLQYKEMFSILLLDIDMGVLDGIETAKRLKNNGIEPLIIMISSKRERFKEAFMIGASRFVTKPIDKDELVEAIQYAKSQIIGYTTHVVSKKGRKYKIFEKDIEYIKAVKDYVEIVCKQETYDCNCPLKKMEETLDEELFMSCHRSYVVNISKIRDLQDDCIITISGKEIPISRRKKKGMMKAIMNFELRGKI